MLSWGGLDCLGENVHPVKVAAEGMGTRGLQMDLQSCGSQISAEESQVVYQGFTTRDNNNLWIGSFSFSNQVSNIALRTAYIASP